MKAYYFQPNVTVALDVIGKPKAGLADLGRGNDILIKGVPISDTKGQGTCVLIQDEAAKPEAKPSKQEPDTQSGKPAEETAKEVAK